MIPTYIYTKVSAKILETHNFDWENPRIIGRANISFKDYFCKSCGVMLYNQHSNSEHFWVLVLKDSYDDINEITCNELIMKEVLE